MRRIIILAVVVAVIIGGWSIAWVYASGIIRDNVTALADADGESTPKLTCEHLDIGGYPFWFEVTCGAMTIAQGDLSATVAEAKATVLVYDPWHAVIVATGPLNYEDAFTGSKRRLDWKALEASARLTGWRIARISIIGDDFALNDTVGGDHLLAKTKHAEFHLLDIPQQYDAAKHLAALALYAKADDLVAPGFSINDGKATLDATLSALPDDVRTYGDADMLRRWQAAGGKLNLVGFKGGDGADTFDVGGNLALDAAGKPAGQLTITSKGLVDRLGPLLVPDQWRGVVLGTPAADGTSTQVLNFTNGLVFSGLIPLGAVPPLM